jgi:hypothetical protein
VKDVNFLDKKKKKQTQTQLDVTKKIQKIMYGIRYKDLVDSIVVCVKLLANLLSK